MIMPKEPLVSIIMNCYNGEKYLREALNSVIEQTFQNWELIFWDNQSSDRSAFVFKRYDEKRFKYFYSPKHTLLYEARNYAIEKASGEFYAFLDVDDWWDTKKLEKQIPLFDDIEVGLVYGNYWEENEQKKFRRILYKKILPTGRILDDLLKDYVVGLLTIVIRRNAFESLHYPFNPNYHVIGDFDCVIRLAAGDWKLDCVQEPVAHNRWTGNNETNKNKDKHIKELEHWYSEMKQHSVISTETNFSIEITNKILYMKTKLQIENKNYYNTFSLMKNFPIGIMKLKLLAFFILPNRILNFFRS
jgi:glycosyltransferase involved in cell wall biosynthesis